MYSSKSCPLLKVDLHVHTTASDGAYRPSEVIRLAREKEIEYIAITDHDTTEGLAEALREGDVQKIKVFPGVEISTVYEEEEIHILGYFINTTNKALQLTLRKLTEARHNRARAMVKKLQELGYNVALEEVLARAGPGAVGRPHIALVLMEKGYFTRVEEVFAQLLNPGCPAYVPRFKISPYKAVALIKGAEGVPVLAHPGENFPAGLLTELIETGLSGIEVYHPHHPPHLEKFYYELALQYGLLVTGGSDFHGHDPEELNEFGSVLLPSSFITRLLTAQRSKDGNLDR